MATITEKQLGQNRPPTGGTAVSNYSPASGTAIIKSIVVCNTSGAAATYSIFLDDDGTTYDQTTAVFFDVPIDADDTHLLQVYWPLDSAGNLATEASVNNAVTFTSLGMEIT